MNNSAKLLQQKIVYIIFTKLHALLILSFMIETYCCKIIKVIILLKEMYIYFDGKIQRGRAYNITATEKWICL